MALRTTGDITEDAQGRGAWGEATPKPPPRGGPPRLHAPALVPVCSAVKASAPPPPCDRAPPSSRSLAETWGAASRRAPGTATRGPRAGVGPQSGDRLLSRCRPQRSSVPRRAVAQKIRFCPEAQPAQPWASYGSAADESQRETQPLGTAAMSAWAGFSPPRRDRGTQGGGRPSHCPRGEKRGPGGSRRLPQSEAAPGWGRGCCRPHVGKAPGPAAAAGFWPESPPAPGTSPLECLWGLAQLKVPKSFAKQLPGV